MRGGAFASLRGGAFGNVEQLTRFDLVGLGQDDPVAHRGVVEHVEDLAVDVLDAVPRVDQHQRALERLAPAQEIVDQVAPAAEQVLGRLGEAVARHVDEAER